MAQDIEVVASPGYGGLPKIAIAAADGARAEVYLHGAHVTSWLAAGSPERLFVSATSHFGADAAIRGGVPICFPQFADQGPLPMHGFARTAMWQLVRAGRRADGAAEAVLRLVDSAATRTLWPHAFALEYTVAVTGSTLTLALAVANTGAAPFSFTGALHTYLRIADVRATRVRGLRGAHYRDKVLRQDDVVESAPELAIDRPIDRVYCVAPADLAVAEPDRSLAILASGFFDTVVWNPGAGATIADLEPGGYGHMLCVEAAVAHAPVVVAPGARWRGMQTLTAR
jgi:glucose-6-phosphate 1-epimerase